MAGRSQFDYKPFTFRDLNAPGETKGEFVSAFAMAQAAEQPLVQEEPQAPVFSEEELAKAREEGRREGYIQGKVDAETAFNHALREQQQSLALLVSDLMSRIDVEVGHIQQMHEQQRKEVGTLVLLLAKKLVGNALTSQPLGALEPTIAECMTLLQGQAHVSIAVEPALVETVRSYVAVHAREGRMVEVIADDKLSSGDCRIQWPGGKAERNQGALWREAERIIARTMSLSPLDIAHEEDIEDIDQ